MTRNGLEERLTAAIRRWVGATKAPRGCHHRGTVPQGSALARNNGCFTHTPEGKRKGAFINTLLIKKKKLKSKS